MCIMTLNRQPGPREQQVLVDRCTQRYCMKTFQEIIVIRGDDTAVNTPRGGVRVRGRTHLSPPLPLSNRSMLQPEWPDVVEFIMGRRNRDGAQRAAATERPGNSSRRSPQRDVEACEGQSRGITGKLGFGLVIVIFLQSKCKCIPETWIVVSRTK